MKVGITYDLRDDYLAEGYGEEETAEFDRPETIEGIAGALASMGFEVERIGNFKRLVAALAEGRGRWDIVFNIAEGLYGMGREALVPALLDAYRIPYVFSDPLTLTVALHKGMAKRVVRSAGVATPDFAEIAEIEDVAAMRLPFPVFVKPVAEGTGKGIGAASKVASREELERVAGRLLDRFRQPVLVEAYLPGREFTVGVLGTGSDARAVGVMEVVFNRDARERTYSYFTKAHYETEVAYRLVEDGPADACGELSLRVWRTLGCRDGGRVDIRLDAAGVPNFIEVNPLAGLNPTHSDLPILCGLAGIDFQRLVGEIMRSAMTRCGLERNWGKTP